MVVEKVLLYKKIILKLYNTKDTINKLYNSHQIRFIHKIILYLTNITNNNFFFHDVIMNIFQKFYHHF